MRALRSSPGFTVTAVLTLALGLGTTTAMYSVVHAVLIRPLPFPDSHRIVGIWVWEGNAQTGASYEAAVALAANPAFAAVAWEEGGGARLIGLGEPEMLVGSFAPPAFFQVFTGPVLGRVYEDSELDAVLISHDLWVRKYGSDAHVIGRVLPLDRQPLRIVGVMPKGFAMPIGRDYWRAPWYEPEVLAQHGAGFFEVMARLSSDLTREQAQAQADSVMGQLQQQFPKEYGPLRFEVIPLKEAMAYDIDQLLYLLFGAVVVVLLIACTNVATLMLVRTRASERDLAVRSALGASRLGLIRSRCWKACSSRFRRLELASPSRCCCFG